MRPPSFPTLIGVGLLTVSLLLVVMLGAALVDLRRSVGVLQGEAIAASRANRTQMEDGVLCTLEQLVEHRVANDRAHDQLNAGEDPDGVNPPPPPEIPTELATRCDAFIERVEDR